MRQKLMFITGLCVMFVMTCGLSYSGGPALEPKQVGLWWRVNGDDKEVPYEKITFIYGEMDVLASAPLTYYCGFGWGAGKGTAGGYTGIQEHQGEPHNVIFSAWDTSRQLLAYAAQADASTVAFHGNPDKPQNEGNTFHTHAPCDWKVGTTFRFVVTKRPHKSANVTLVTFYFFDDKRKSWLLEASLASPPVVKGADRCFANGKYSFLERMGGDENTPRVCIYRIWAGTTPEDVVYLRKARPSSGASGIVNGCYCLARGDTNAIAAVVAKMPRLPGDVAVSRDNDKMKEPIIPDRPLPDNIIKELKVLPAPEAAGTD